MSLSLVLPQDTAASGVGLVSVRPFASDCPQREPFLSGVSESHAVRYGDVGRRLGRSLGASSRRWDAVTSPAVEVGGGLEGSQTFQRGPYLESERRWSTAVDRDSDPALYARFTSAALASEWWRFPGVHRRWADPATIALDFGLPVLPPTDGSARSPERDRSAPRCVRSMPPQRARPGPVAIR